MPGRHNPKPIPRMFTITITESEKPEGPSIERLRQNLDGPLDRSILLAVITLLNKPPKKPRSDKGKTRTQQPTLAV